MKVPQKTSRGNAARLTGRRAAYSLAAGAAAALPCTDADAEVRYSLTDEIPIAQGYSQFLNLDNDEYGDLKLENYVFFGGNYQGLYVQYAPGKAVGFRVALAYASALDAGVLVDDAAVTDGVFDASLAYGSANPSAEFNNAENKFIGLGFPINGEVHYGWVRVSIDNAAGSFIIHDWAYESEVGVGITTGDNGLSGAPGDFNDDGAVDAADYAVWRNNLGQTGSGLLSGNGVGDVVDEYDYDVWRYHYGSQYGVPAANTAPEPVSLGLLAAGAAGVGALRRARSAGRSR